ncbi:NACHT domain-containing protein [Streptomyces kronopolitis]|uniref:NACHT domain-containing protein n=1 Tax=Streptomyces kronopolitis TaxID=1612435 RepID=UPI00341ABBD6
MLYVSSETAAGLFPDVLKSVVGDSPRWVTVACVVALLVAGVALYIRSLHTRLADSWDGAEPDAEQLRRGRKALMHRVHQNWTRPLAFRWNDAVRLEIGVRDFPSAVHDPWGGGEFTTSADAPLPAGTDLRSMFERHDQQLLVLGAPGAGKTVHLLELTAALLDEARSDADAPVPVFLLLTTWRGGPLDAWMVSELRHRYRTSADVTRTLLAQGKICFLLDGLDEVDPERQEECLSRINAFISADGYPHCSLVVSCRLTDYRLLSRRLTMNGAVTVQPLPVTAVHAFLHAAGSPVRGLCTAAATDPALARLLTTPLMLGVAVLAYSGVDESAVHSAGTLEERRGLVYDAFLTRMVTRDRTLRGTPKPPRFSVAQVESRLLLMAREMRKYQVTVIYPKDPLRLMMQAPPEVLEQLHSGSRLRLIFARFQVGYLRILTVVSPYRSLMTALLSLFRYTVLFPYLRKDFVHFACERGLLRRSGDGVAFLHKTFQDHLSQRADGLTPQERSALYRQAVTS